MEPGRRADSAPGLPVAATRPASRAFRGLGLPSARGPDLRSPLGGRETGRQSRHPPPSAPWRPAPCTLRHSPIPCVLASFSWLHVSEVDLRWVTWLGRRAEDLSPEQHRLAIKVKPSFLEYSSYLLNFMSVIAGPCNNFKDYIAFIEGRHIHMKLLEVNWKQRGFHSLPEPSPTRAVIQKLCLTLLFVLLFLTLTKSFPVTFLVDDWFVHKANFLTRLCYLYAVMQASKPKYYFAWTLADAVHNAAGFGFSGIDEDGDFCWDLLSNLNIWKIETATSLKMYLENWNIQTSTWLKRVCYERVPWYPTVLTFILSALWHGVYPGYYFTFLTGVPVTLAARAVRSNFRHHFLSSKALKLVYDVVTWATTQLAVSYIAAPFVLLAVEPTISLYKSIYFFLHIVSLLIILFLPIKPHHPQRWPQSLNSVHKKAD